MADRVTKSKRRTILIIVILIMALLSLWVVQMVFTRVQPMDTSNNVRIEKGGDQEPLRIQTNDELMRYTQNLTGGTVTKVSEQHVYLAQNVDWNSEVVVAVIFSTADYNVVTSYTIEDFQGEKVYMIDILEPVECHARSFVNTQRVAFIKQPSSDPVLPVILRITPSAVSCDDLPL